MVINLTNTDGLDARIQAESIRTRSAFTYVDLENRPVASRRLLKATVEEDLASLVDRFGDLDAVAQSLIDADPEVDTERFGSFLTDTARVYINNDGEVAHSIRKEVIVFDAEGEERERRPVPITEPNVATSAPIRWTGTRIPKSEAVRRFVFSRSLQLVHINGLTYEFLYGMASDLALAGDLVLLGAGEDGKRPLIFRRRGRPYRGFLEGRVHDDAYLLRLHLSNLELRSLA